MTTTEKRHYTTIRPYDVILGSAGREKTIGEKDLAGIASYSDPQGFIDAVLYKQFLRGEFIGWMSGAEKQDFSKRIYQKRHLEANGEKFDTWEQLDESGAAECEVVWHVLNKHNVYEEDDRIPWVKNNLGRWCKKVLTQ